MYAYLIWWKYWGGDVQGLTLKKIMETYRAASNLVELTNSNEEVNGG